MTLELRDVAARDLPALHAMNEAEVPHVNSVPVSLFAWYLREAAYFRAACRDGVPVGFLAGLEPPMADHPSRYFRWFREHYPAFLYIDRVVVAPSSRRLGAARLLYADVERFAAGRVPLLACEVNLEPRNEASLRFHRHMGFREVDRLATPEDGKRVSLLVREPAGPGSGA